MTPEDIPEAQALWAAAEGVELSEGDDAASLDAYLRRNPGCSFLARSGDTLAGAVLGGHDGRRGYLYHLAVAPAFQRKGLGRTLAKAALTAIKAQGIKRVLILVLRENEEGRAFWTSLEFEALEGVEARGHTF